VWALPRAVRPPRDNGSAAPARLSRRRHPFNIEAIVVLPDHLHAIWTPPEGDADFALRWRLIKSMFSRGLPAG
jgi:putative transposase